MKFLEVVVGIDIFSALKLGLGQVVLGRLAPGRALAVLGDLGEFFLCLRELALLEELLGGLQLGFRLGIFGGLGDGPPAVGAQDEGRRRRAVRRTRARARAPGRQPAVEQVLRIHGTARISHFVL